MSETQNTNKANNMKAKHKFTVNGKTFTYHAPIGKPGAVCWQDENGDWDGQRVYSFAQAKAIANKISR